MHPLDRCYNFEWDEANSDKNWLQHQVTRSECEDIFFNKRLIFDDEKHSHLEKRYNVLGKTHGERHLFLAVTIRNDNIRVISARDMNRKEKNIYEQTIKNNS